MSCCDCVRPKLTPSARGGSPLTERLPPRETWPGPRTSEEGIALSATFVIRPPAGNEARMLERSQILETTVTTDDHRSPQHQYHQEYNYSA
jgi:hypothetical protein